MIEKEKKIIRKLGKYPQNIIFLLTALLISSAIVYFNGHDNNGAKEIKYKHAGNFSLKEYVVDAENIVQLGMDSDLLAKEIVSAEIKFALNRENGELELKEFSVDKKEFESKKLSGKITLVSAKLDKENISAGKFNKMTGKIDLSAGIMVEMLLGGKSENFLLNIPFKGTFNPLSGKVSLDGKGTIPPDGQMIPIPVEIQTETIISNVAKSKR